MVIVQQRLGRQGVVLKIYMLQRECWRSGGNERRRRRRRRKGGNEDEGVLQVKDGMEIVEGRRAEVG